MILNKTNIVHTEGQDNDCDIKMLGKVGLIKISKTFPSLCRVTMDTAIANLETFGRKTSIDYNGSNEDPVTTKIVADEGKKVPVELIYKEEGTYNARFTANRPGKFCLKVTIKSQKAKFYNLIIF